MTRSRSLPPSARRSTPPPDAQVGTGVCLFAWQPNLVRIDVRAAGSGTKSSPPSCPSCGPVESAASAGIGPNLLVARIAGERAKPNGQMQVQAGQEAREFLQVRPLPSSCLCTDSSLLRLFLQPVPACPPARCPMWLAAPPTLLFHLRSACLPAPAASRRCPWMRCRAWAGAPASCWRARGWPPWQTCRWEEHQLYWLPGRAAGVH